MSKVHCIKYGAEQDAIPYTPYPGELGRRIAENVGLKFWQEWLAQQTMLINENHYSPIDPEHRAILERAMQAFLFEGQDERPAGYVPPEE